MVPHRTPFFLPMLFPSSLIWRIPTTQPELYLTFDDGPVDGPTDFVLEVLQEYSASATFFCIGDNVRKHEHVFQKICHQGHRVGNHTFNHVNGWKSTLDDYTRNVKQCDDQMNNLLPPEMLTYHPLFRPPYGRITRSQITALRSYKIIMWDVLSVDYNSKLAPEKCLRNTVNAARPGSILVFHDSFKAEKNLVHVLPRLLDHFKNRGYAFKVLPHNL